MTLTAADIQLLLYLAEHCTAPDKAGSISIDRHWSSTAEAKTVHAKALSSALHLNSDQLEALISRLEQFGLVGKRRTSTSFSVWITAAGQDACHDPNEGAPGVGRKPTPRRSLSNPGDAIEPKLEVEQVTQKMRLEMGTANGGHTEYRPALWEKITVTVAACAVLSLIAWLVIRNAPFNDPNLVVMLRIVLSLAIAALGAAVPGFLGVGVKASGVAVRAGGALALFVISFFFTPQVITPPLTPPTDKNATTGSTKEEAKSEATEDNAKQKQSRSEDAAGAERKVTPQAITGSPKDAAKFEVEGDKSKAPSPDEAAAERKALYDIVGAIDPEMSDRRILSKRLRSYLTMPTSGKWQTVLDDLPTIRDDCRKIRDTLPTLHGPFQLSHGPEIQAIYDEIAEKAPVLKRLQQLALPHDQKALHDIETAIPTVEAMWSALGKLRELIRQYLQPAADGSKE
jgi:hypothetical protein